MVGYMHDDIDASFGRWSMKLHEEDHPTIPLLTNSYLDMDNVLVILHMIEEVSDFKAFINPYMLKKNRPLNWTYQSSTIPLLCVG
jgi:hypothetical protein